MPAPDSAGDTAVTLRVVTFNIKYADEPDSALALILGDPDVNRPDIMTLQEVDAPTVAYLAAELRMGYVFYPVRWRSENRRQMGNAVLSRWPIEEDAKVRLPHRGRFLRNMRGATAATVRIGAHRVRVYSVHVATFTEISGRQRRDQVDSVLNDAERYHSVIIGGDFNNHSVGNHIVARGYQWPTRDGPRTVTLGRWDHIFLRGLALRDSASTGTVLHRRGSSDHRPVWAVVRLGGQPAGPLIR